MDDPRPAPSSSPEPLDGDVVIAYDPSAASAWVINEYPGPAQLAVRSQQEAVEMALAHATETRVNVWLSEGNGRRLLHNHRG